MSLTNELGERSGRTSNEWARELLSSFVERAGIYYLLIERVSTVTNEFIQYQARIQIGLNRTDIERFDLFTTLGQ
jgi:hypothetical protein